MQFPHSRTPAWKIPWTEKPGRLQSMGLWRDGHDWSDLAVGMQFYYLSVSFPWLFFKFIGLNSGVSSLLIELHFSTSSVQFSHWVTSDSLQPHGLQQARFPCPSLTPGVYSNSGPLSWWCHPTISSSVVPFSSRLRSFPGSESFQMSQLFASNSQSIGVSASASVLPMNT